MSWIGESARGYTYPDISLVRDTAVTTSRRDLFFAVKRLTATAISSFDCSLYPRLDTQNSRNWPACFSIFGRKYMCCDGWPPTCNLQNLFVVERCMHANGDPTKFDQAQHSHRTSGPQPIDGTVLQSCSQWKVPTSKI